MEKDAQLKGNEYLIYKFNQDSKAEFHEITNSKAYKLLVMLCNGKANEISNEDKVWLINEMRQETYLLTGKSINVLGWRLCFEPYLTRFIYRLNGDQTFTIIWGIDKRSVETYLEELFNEQVVELIKLPENY